MLTKKKTLEFKKSHCQHCKHCDLRALRKGWPACNLLETSTKNGHCLQIEYRNPKVQ